jgi:hypothetical protein
MKGTKGYQAGITAIDPGNEESAYCSIDSKGRLRDFGKLKNEALLGLLRTGGFYRDRVFIEMIASYGMAVGREVFDTCVWIGRFSEAYMGSIPIEPVFRKDVKLHICQSPKANDSNIRAALIDRYGPGKVKAIGVKKAPGPLYGVSKDVWSALAIALTAKETRIE